MKILLCTGIYPPEIGGPANYAKQLHEELELLGHHVPVATYTFERKLPTGIRHVYYLFKILPKMFGVDAIILLDPFSVGLPGFVAAKLFRKKIIMRTGGDFLWETYTDRVPKPIILREFYKPLPSDLTIKEKLIYWWVKKLLSGLDAVIFSTKLQRDVFLDGYEMNRDKVFIVENFYGQREGAITEDPVPGTFFWAGRRIGFKNIPHLEEAFEIAKRKNSSISLKISPPLTRDETLEEMKKSAVIIYPSLTEISPNFILESIMLGRPFICTREVGLYERIKDIGVFADPTSAEDLAEKILYLADEENYEVYRKKVQAFEHVHTYADIAKEFEIILKKIS